MSTLGLVTTKEVDSLEEIGKDLIALDARGPHAVAYKCYRWTEYPIMDESKKQCPKDTGRLVRSGTVNPPRNEGGAMSIEFGYGAQNPETGENYAAIQHENPNYRHKNNEKWKYLEDPFNMFSSGYVREMIKALDEIVFSHKINPAPSTSHLTTTQDITPVNILPSSSQPMALKSESFSTGFAKWDRETFGGM